MSKFKLHVETARILQLLSDQIYDSPNALLRENLQNAFDATLMRATQEGRDPTNFPIHIEIGDGVITFTDHGIGMTEETLTQHYWSAGSSGKKTELARRAGVVGTFGIGAMANFGVATALEVDTMHIDGENALLSTARLEDLSLDTDCINLQAGTRGEPGTTVKVTMKEGYKLSPKQAIDYLLPFVQYLNVPVSVNEHLISNVEFYSNITSTQKIATDTLRVSSFDAELQLFVEPSSSIIQLKCEALKLNGETIGRFSLCQDSRSIMGFRSGFGLATIPITGSFQWGGHFDASFLQPTAGREALTRDSVQMTYKLVLQLDQWVVERIAENPKIADINFGFLQFIKASGKYDLAQNVAIYTGKDEYVRLGSIQPYRTSQALFYRGSDRAIISQFASSNQQLYLISNRQPRKSIQEYWMMKLGIQEVPNRAQVTREFQDDELSRDELALKVRLEVILSEDYLISKPTVRFSQISHGVAILVEDKSNHEKPIIYLHRENHDISSLLQLREDSPDVFIPFVKDYVRNSIFRHIQNFVPSATRQGAEALRKLLDRRKELYRYEFEEVGELDPLISEYYEGTLDLEDVVRKASSQGNVRKQSVEVHQIGTIEHEIPTLSTDIQTQIDQQVESISSNFEFVIEKAMPGIVRLDTETDMKILTTDAHNPKLGNFKTFLGLTDKVSNNDKDFFMAPHFTRVIWAQHRIVFVFQHPSGKITFYYDVELREPIDEKTGGMDLSTTTLITKNRIFVPVPTVIDHVFAIKEGVREFIVRHDYV